MEVEVREVEVGETARRFPSDFEEGRLFACEETEERRDLCDDGESGISDHIVLCRG